VSRFSVGSVIVQLGPLFLPPPPPPLPPGSVGFAAKTLPDNSSRQLHRRCIKAVFRTTDVRIDAFHPVMMSSRVL
jgi:hypothetical protein